VTPSIHSFIHSFYLIQAAWPIKHKNTYTKHRNAKLKKGKKENEEKKRLTGYTTATQQKKSVNVHSNKVLH